MLCRVMGLLSTRDLTSEASGSSLWGMRDHRNVRGDKASDHRSFRRDPSWRVALVGGSPPERASTGAAITRHGGIVTLEAPLTEYGLREVEQVEAEVAVVVSTPEWRDSSALFRLRDEVHCPVVVLACDPSRRLLSEAREAGVMACLIQPCRPLQLAVTLDLAVARFREADTLRRKLADRKVIERAKGVIMAQQGLTEEQAFSRLRRSAMDAQCPLAEMASAVLVSRMAAAPA